MKIKFPLFKNDRKESDKHPDYKFYDKESGASAAAWIREKNGRKYLSVQYEEGEQRQQSRQAEPVPAPSADDFDDDPIPF